MIKFNYEIFGKGEKSILFLHGWGGNINSFNNLISSLQYNYKIIKVDLFGFGESELPSFIDNIYAYALELYLKLKELKLDNFSIVAHSFGGRLALILAGFFDTRIEKLILIGCAGIKPKRKLKTTLKIVLYKSLKKLNQSRIFRVDLRKFGSDDYRNLAIEMKRLFVNVVNEDLGWLLKNIKQKSLVINGEKDTSTPPYMAKFISRNIQGSKLLILKNSGHFCYLENQYFILNEIIEFV